MSSSCYTNLCLSQSNDSSIGTSYTVHIYFIGDCCTRINTNDNGSIRQLKSGIPKREFATFFKIELDFDIHGKNAGGVRIFN